MKRLLVAAGLAVLGCLGASSNAGAAGPYEFASGAATVHHSFAWSAHERDGADDGHMEVHFRDGTKLHANVTCFEAGYEFVGPGPLVEVATVFGIVYKEDNDIAEVGDPIEFELVDRGNDGKDDEFRFNPSTNPDDPREPDCTFDPGGFPIRQGNVQVEPLSE